MKNAKKLLLITITKNEKANFTRTIIIKVWKKSWLDAFFGGDKF